MCVSSVTNEIFDRTLGFVSGLFFHEAPTHTIARGQQREETQ